MSDERRSEVRIESANLINYSHVKQPEHPEEKAVYDLLGTARTEDLSANGCRLISSSALPQGLELTFDFKMADAIVRCGGTVVRVTETKPGEEWEHGVAFTDLDDLAKDGIRLYLEFKQGQEE